MPRRGAPTRAGRLVRDHWPLLVLLALGLATRAAMMVASSPAILSYPDTWGYVKGAAEELFVPEVRRPAGYAVFLRMLHGFSASITLVVVVQHLMGLAATVVVYAIALRAGAGRWLSLIPAAVAAISFDHLYIEHTLVSETLFGLLTLLAVLVAQIAITPPGPPTRREFGLYATAGLLLAAAVTVRPTALLTIGAVVVIVIVLTHGGLGRRFARGAAVAVPAATLVLVYMVAQNAATGYFGLVPGGGWQLYARAAPFADCRHFDPPSGTEWLCEESLPRDRPGGGFYSWDPKSPAYRTGLDWKAADRVVGRWSRAAILQQPEVFIRVAATDLWRFVDPSEEPKVNSGGTTNDVRLDNRDESVEALNKSVADPYYGPAKISTRGLLGTLADVQQTVRFHGPLMLASFVLFLLGLVVARGRALRTMLLLAAVGFLIPMASAVALMFGWRYAVPGQSAMAGAGMLGALQLTLAAQRRYGWRARCRFGAEPSRWLDLRRLGLHGLVRVYIMKRLLRVTQ